MRRLVTLLLTFVLAACTVSHRQPPGTNGSTGSSATSTTGSSGGPGFAGTETDWNLPAKYGSAKFLWGTSYGPSCGPLVAYATLDMNGDGIADLVVANSCGADAAVGDTKWDVWLGTGSGFARTPIPWALPAKYGANKFNEGISWSDGCSPLTYDTVDMNGDHLPDLVVLDACGVDDAVGDTKWDVWLGTGSGFASTPTPWALPTAYGSNQFKAGTSTYNSCDPLMYETEDMNGDGIPDLVVVNGCGGDAALGDTRWDVWLGTTTGFATAPTTWALPTKYGSSKFNVGTEWSFGCSPLVYDTKDMNGDGIADLVVTNGCGVDDAVGDTKWDVWLGTGSGFASNPTAWSLPTKYTVKQFNAGTYASYSSCPQINYATEDMNGDGIPDLVVVDGCRVDDPIGNTQWEVWLGADAGFAATPTAWTLPTKYGSNQFNGQTSWNPGCPALSYATEDMNGDRIADLVVTDACDGADSALGSSKWEVWPGN